MSESFANNEKEKFENDIRQGMAVLELPEYKRIYDADELASGYRNLKKQLKKLQEKTTAGKLKIASVSELAAILKEIARLTDEVDEFVGPPADNSRKP